MTKFLLSILVMTVLFALPSFSAEPKPITMPLRKFLLLQLMSSKYDYAEKKFTGIIFHYGKVTIDPDKMSLENIESISHIMEKGRFMENGLIHDVAGVEWIIKAGLDQPRLFYRLMNHDFVYGNYTEILSPWPNMRTRTTYTFQKREFVKIPEYLAKQEEKGMIDALAISSRELDRVTNSKIGTTPAKEQIGPLLLEGPKSCQMMF